MLAKPVTTDDGTISDVVSRTTYTGGVILPDQYPDFPIAVGSVPQAAAGDAEPAHPAPTLTLKPGAREPTPAAQRRRGRLGRDSCSGPAAGPPSTDLTHSQFSTAGREATHERDGARVVRRGAAAPVALVAGVLLLSLGQRIRITRADGSIAIFAVTGTRSYAKDAFPTAAVYGNLAYPGLRLITCGGDLDRRTRHYLENTVVCASPADQAAVTAATSTSSRRPAGWGHRCRAG